MSCKSCCAECRSEAYWCCGNEWKCNRVRRKMCVHYKKEMRMFKNTIILILSVILLIVICNGTFDLRGPIRVGFPARNSNHSTEAKIEARLMSAARLIEDAKTDKILRSKVEKVLENWE